MSLRRCLRRLKDKDASEKHPCRLGELKTQNFHTKLPCQEPMLRQIELGAQDGPITKNGVLLVTTRFSKTLFQFKNLV